MLDVHALGSDVMGTLSETFSPLLPYAQAITVAELPQIQDALAAVDAAPLDTLKYLLAMFLCFPLGVIHLLLPAGHVRHVFNLVTGVVLAQFVFGWQWVHALASATLVYLTLVLTAPLSFLNNYRAFLCFSVILIYTVTLHLHRVFTDYMGWSLDITGPLMIMTIKLSAIGFNYADGVTNAKATEELLKKKVSPGTKRLYAERARSAINRLPNPLEFYAYVFVPTSFFAGPAFDFRHYLDSVNRSASSLRTLPRRVLRILITLLFGLVFLGLTAYGQTAWPFLVGTAPDSVVNPFLLEQPSTLHTMAYALITLFFVRVKYYFAWLLSESSALVSGFGFNEATGKWTIAANVDVLGFELATTLSNGSKAWNKHTQTWLERYVYKRCPRAGSFNMIMTYAVSAFWHGFYPGYYMMFLSVPLFQNFAKAATIRIRPLTVTTSSSGTETPKAWKPLYDLLTIFLTHCTLNYLASAFVCLSWGNAITLLSAYRFAGHIGVILLWVLLLALFPKPKRKAA